MATRFRRPSIRLLLVTILSTVLASALAATSAVDAARGLDSEDEVADGGEVYSTLSPGTPGAVDKIVDTGPKSEVPDGTVVGGVTVKEKTLDGQLKAVHTKILVEGQKPSWKTVPGPAAGKVTEVSGRACPSGRNWAHTWKDGRGATGLYYRFHHRKNWTYRGCNVRSVRTRTYPSNMRFNVSYEGIASSVGGYREGRWRHWSKRTGHFAISFGPTVHHYPWVAINARANGTWDANWGI